jgi:hypothetical protein
MGVASTSVFLSKDTISPATPSMLNLLPLTNQTVGGSSSVSPHDKPASSVVKKQVLVGVPFGLKG